jgi:hypothetical protein
MQARFLCFVLAAAGLAGCATDPSATPPGPASYYRETQEGRPGIFGDLRWNVDMTGKKESVRVSEEEDFKRWKESNPSSTERREFEEWREWQEWKRKNPGQSPK